MLVGTSKPENIYSGWSIFLCASIKNQELNILSNIYLLFLIVILDLNSLYYIYLKLNRVVNL